MHDRDPLATPPPALPLDRVAEIARREFGVEGRLSPLWSERDQNVRVDASDGGGYVLKISNPADTLAVVEMQTEAIRHIERTDPDLPVMRVVPTPDGRSWVELPGPDGEPLFVRVFSLLPGRIVRSHGFDRDALHRYGSVVARLGRALRGFFHPAAAYEILWDLRNASRLRSFLAEVEDPARRDVAERALDRFDERVAPVFGTLRAQVVHNDLTIDNVLLDDRQRITGIVDFGDLTHTALVCDLAIALASLVWQREDPFEAAADVIRGYGNVTRLEREETDLLGDLVLARIVAWGVIAAWRAPMYPQNADYITAGDDAAWAFLARLVELGFDDVARRFRDASRDAILPFRRSPSADLLARRRRLLHRSPLVYERPLHLVRGEGTWMFDANGKRYLDAYNNVPSVGHAHPRVARAIAEQSETLATNTRYLHEAIVELAERLTSTLPAGLDAALFVNSGSEANDLAWRLARAFTKGTGAVVSERAYHGLTQAAAALSPEEWAEGERPEHVAVVPAPDGYRGRYRREEAGWAARYATHVAGAADGLGAGGFPIAALFVDPAFTSDGILVPPPDFLQHAARAVREAGGLVVADEVQAGHGRYGSHLWSFQASGIEPDIVTMGKPMGNGHPVAAVVTRPEIVESLAREAELFSTFGGNPVSAVAALAVLDVIEEEGLMERARDVGARLRTGLEGLPHALIGDVRGEGLLIGVELVRDRGTREPAGVEATAVMNAMRDLGVLIGVTGPAGNVLKIRPPLVFGTDEADLLVRTLDEVLDARG